MRLPLEDKIYGLTKLYTEAKYNFAFWNKVDINWDEEYQKTLKNVMKCENRWDYYKELTRFIMLLNDGHTGINLPNDIIEKENIGELPIDISLFEEKWIITNIHIKYKKEVEQYSIIKKINDVEVEEYFEKYVYPYAWCAVRKDTVSAKKAFYIDKMDKTVKLEIETPNHKVKTVWIKRESVKEPYPFAYKNKISKLPNDVKSLYKLKENQFEILATDSVGIICVNTFMYNDLASEIMDHIDLIKDKKGIIIDLRNNGGGNSKNADQLLSMFTDRSFYNGRSKSKIHLAEYKAWANALIKFNNLRNYDEYVKKHGESKWAKKCYDVLNNIYFEENDMREVYYKEYGDIFKQPTVVLTSPETASAAEDFVIAYKGMNRGLIIGQPTYGSTGQPLFFDLPFGGSARICTRYCLMIDGTDFINEGIKPDIEVNRSYDEYIENEDFIEDKALKQALDILIK